MKIETKYSLHDKVWYESMGHICNSEIIEISLFYYQGELKICYAINHPYYCFNIRMPESAMFLTKEELLKSL